MDFTATQQDILYRARLLARDGKGQLVTDEALPDAAELAGAGWLEPRAEKNGDTSWWWTPAAEGALDINALLQSAEGRQH